MPWKIKPIPHEHDMPGPKKLGNQGALKGWVWTCACGDYELIAYRQANGSGPGSADWRDVLSGQAITLTKET